MREQGVGLPAKGNSNSHSARPVHLIVTMMQWIRTSRLSMKDSLCLEHAQACPKPAICAYHQPKFQGFLAHKKQRPPGPRSRHK